MRTGPAIEYRNPACGGEALRGAIYALLIAVPAWIAGALILFM
jgi:hypothetical protein